jgi:carbamoylphosphate synthase large subunit
MSSDVRSPALPGSGSAQRPTLWLGAAGTAAAFGILRCVRERWSDRIRVVAGDIHPPHLVAASSLCDRYEQVPPFCDPGFRDFVLPRLHREGVDFYAPILDEEILLAAQWRDEGLLGRVRTVGLPLESARICFDKLAAFRWLREHGLPTPETELSPDARWAGRSMVAKPRRGRGSIGLQSVASAQDLERLRSDRNLVLQPACRGPEVTIDGFRSSDGSCFRAVARARLEVKAGVCTKARVFEDAELSRLGREIADGFGLTGAFCFQVMRGPEHDGWLVTDINPRPGAGARLSAAAGVDTLAAMVADGLQLDVELDALMPPLPHETFVVRQYQEFVLG